MNLLCVVRCDGDGGYTYFFFSLLRFRSHFGTALQFSILNFSIDENYRRNFCGDASCVYLILRLNYKILLNTNCLDGGELREYIHNWLSTKIVWQGKDRMSRVKSNTYMVCMERCVYVFCRLYFPITFWSTLHRTLTLKKNKKKRNPGLYLRYRLWKLQRTNRIIEQ